MSDPDPLQVHVAADVFDEIVEFIQWATHDDGCSGRYPRYRCKCGLRDLRFKLVLIPEPHWPDDVAQPTRGE